ncbi:group III truncated hemoglobin [Pedobacter immunditicola]|uniref:group III truncated hemoglobin n=1 Tax=Pedobacter immunditicola TaxID=3133440 RepID=UPI00309B80DA
MNNKNQEVAAEKPDTDILTESDVKLLVNTFYDKVRKDEILAPVFEPIIKDNWEVHLSRMTDFWSTLLLYTKKYKDDPMPKHLPLQIGKDHFDRWLLLFNLTIDELFEGTIAENARKRANSIAKIMKAVKGIS